MREARGKKHDFSSLVARVIGAVSEMHARRFQRPRNAADGLADGLAVGADGFNGCVG